MPSTKLTVDGLRIVPTSLPPESWLVPITCGAATTVSLAKPRSVNAFIPGSVTASVVVFTRIAPKFGSEMGPV